MLTIYISKICFSYINLPCIYTIDLSILAQDRLLDLSLPKVCLVSMYLYLLFRKSVYPGLVSLRKVVAGRGTSREYWILYRGPGFLAVVLIWFLAHPLLPSENSTGDTQEGGGGKGAGEEPIRLQESMVLYKSFITLWVHLLTPRN